MNQFKLIIDLLENAAIPIALSRANYLSIKKFLSRFKDLEQMVLHSDELAKELVSNFNTHFGDDTILKSIELFKNNSANTADAYADFEKHKIIFTRDFLEYEMSELYSSTSLDIHSILSFSEVVDHEMVHFIQFHGGAFNSNPGRDKTTLSKDTTTWHEKSNKPTKYDFHSVNTYELQAWGVQIATGAINRIMDKLDGVPVNQKYKNFNDLYRAVMNLDDVKQNMELQRIDGVRFNVKHPTEKQAIKKLQTAFIKTLQDFYYDGDDRQDEYNFATEKGIQRRELKFKRK
jgi:hypothetical protein